MGKLIAIEGIDGIGKATALHNLAQCCKNHNISHTIMTFPSYDRDIWNQVIKHYLKHAPARPSYLESMILIMSYAGDRYKRKEELQKALDSYDLVILDRFVASNIAYQMAHLMEYHQQRKCLNFIHYMEHYKLKLSMPDLYVLLYGQVALVAKNLKKSNKDLDSHERNLHYLELVQKQYLKLANLFTKIRHHTPWVTINIQDGEQIISPKIITQQIWQVLKSIGIVAGNS